MSDAGSKKTTTLAERFLEDARDANRPVSVYLANGYQLKGEVVEFDDETLLFKHKEVYQLVMRSAIASMYPTASPKHDVDGWWRTYANAAAPQ